jgi:hypothetical protein
MAFRLERTLNPCSRGRRRSTSALKELQAILDDGAVASAFGMRHPIDKIERVDVDRFRVSSGSCTMDIAIKDDPKRALPPGWTGSRRFVLERGAFTCKSN